MDAAAAAYVALTADGTDTLLMAADHALRRELNRRIRDDLITLGIVTGGPAVTIADGTRASAGDLIICTRNDHGTEAGEPGRTLANGDLLRIEAITKDGLLVRRALDADPATGQRRWTDRHFVFNNHKDAELGYAVTDHAAQGRTVHTGLAVITGTEDRQHAYVALSRGTEVNLAYVFTAVPQDRRPGPRPAPGPRARPLRPPRRPRRARPLPPPTPADPLTVLAGVLDRDGQQHSATQTRNQALADADHLAILHAIWAAETTPARDQHYQRPAHGHPAARLPPGTRPPGEVAVAHPARRRTGRPGPRPLSWPTRSPNGTWPDPATSPPSSTPASATASAPWSRSRPGRGRSRSPPSPTPNAAPYVAEIAALMDARTDRIGEHAASHPLPWATAALGPVPGSPARPARLAETGRRRSAPGGNCPATTTPPTRSAPNRPRPPQTFGPPGTRPWPPSARADGPDVRGMPDGRLLHLRDTYPIETAWAPRYVGDELRQVRAAAWDARLAGLRAAAEARAAEHRGDHDHAAARQQAGRRLPGPGRGLPAARDRLRPDHGRPRRLGHRHPRPAPARRRRRRRTAPPPPRPVLRARCAPPNPSPPPPPSATTSPSPPTSRPVRQSQWIKDLAAGHRTFAGQLADRQSQTIPSEDPDYADLGPAFPALDQPAQGADLAAAQARDPALPAHPRPRHGPRHRLGSRRLTQPGAWKAGT